MNTSVRLSAWKEFFLFFLFVSLTGSDLHAQEVKRFSFSEPHMGTRFGIICYAEKEDLAKAAADSAFGRIAELEEIMSDYQSDSELNRLSDTSGQNRWVAVSHPLFEVLERAQHISKETDGAFDVTLGPYVQLWRSIHRQSDPERPSNQLLDSLAGSVGYKYIELDPDQNGVLLAVPNMQLDLGAIAKGYAADEALNVLNHFGIRSVLIDAGGDITLGDAPPDQSAWKIQIEQYDSDGEARQRNLALSNAAVATSGDLFQFVEIDGERYSHIIDPETGLGTTDQRRVTVIAPNGTEADAYASAFSVLEPDRAVELAEYKKNLSVFIALHAEDTIQTHESDQFEKFLVD